MKDFYIHCMQGAFTTLLLSEIGQKSLSKQTKTNKIMSVIKKERCHTKERIQTKTRKKESFRYKILLVQKNIQKGSAYSIKNKLQDRLRNIKEELQ